MEFRIGVGKTDITPNYGSPTRRWHLPGGRARISDIRTQGFARTVAMSDGIRTVTLTSMDLCCYHKVHHDRIRAVARERMPAPVDTLLLHNTHQHSDSFIEYEPCYDRFGINDIAFDLDYVHSLPGRVATSIGMAVQHMEPARLAYGSGTIEEGIASCRRTVLDDGRLGWRSSRPEPALRDLPRGVIDPEVGVAAFVTPDGRTIATLYNYACHPSSAGGDSPSVFSADFPGFASEIIEREVGGVALFLHGCSGDINPGKYIRGDAEDCDDRIADAKRMGRMLAEETLKVFGRMESEEVRRFGVIHKEVALPVQPGAGDVEAARAGAEHAIKSWRTQGADPRTALRKYAIAHKIKDGRCRVDMGAVAINELAVACLPGEPFTELGRRIKQGCPARQTLIAATCGEDPYYMPTAEAMTQGGYETGYIAIPETGETWVQEANALLAELFA
jgi:hypothetical protein